MRQVHFAVGSRSKVAERQSSRALGALETNFVVDHTVVDGNLKKNSAKQNENRQGAKQMDG